MSNDDAARVLAEKLGKRAQIHAQLGSRTTYRVGGKAAVLVTVNSIQDLHDLADALGETDLPVLAVGNGSNMLVADSGFAGVAVMLGESFEHFSVEPDPADLPPGSNVVVQAGSAIGLPVLARRLAGLGVREFEWAVGVPGTIGGAVRMNAGGHGSDMQACVTSASMFALRSPHEERERVLTATDLQFAYRSSSIDAHELVVSARLDLVTGNAEEASAMVSDIVAWRRANQPGGQNCGSVFSNPKGSSAGALIEQAGFKGHTLGTARVSERHANFIQSSPDGQADDIFELIGVVRAGVQEKTGVALSTEVRLIGFDEVKAS